MKPSSWTATGAWFACAVVAVLFAAGSPSERALMGQLPQGAVDALDKTRKALPPNPAGERTLAMLVFHRDQKPELRSWIAGMDLTPASPLPWVKLRVVPDQRIEGSRQQVEARMQAGRGASGRTVPVFSDADSVVRALSLPNADHAHVLVLDGSGNVLARAAGSFDEQKAAALLETLLSP